MATTPAGIGGSPAAVQSRSPQASTWAVIEPTGDQDALISSSALDGSPSIPPKLSDATRVTVPLGTNGRIDLYNSSGTTDLLADVTG